jgi:hypothetical protein
MKSILVRITLAIGLSGFLVAVPSFETAPAHATGIDAIYKITSIETDGVPVGCVGVHCPSTRTNTPAYAPQPSFSADLATATKIDTHGQWITGGYSDMGGCAIIANGLRCWGLNNGGQLGDETTTDSPTTPVIAVDGGQPLTGVTDVASTSAVTCAVVSGALKCVGFGLTGNGFYNGVPYSTSWMTLVASGVEEVILGGTWQHYGNNIPICYRSTTGRVYCGNIYDPVDWQLSRFTNIVDIAVASENNGGSLLKLCVAGGISACVSFDSGVFRDEIIVQGVSTSEAVYAQSIMMSGLCFYASGTLLCGSLNGNEHLVKAVAVIAKPLSMFTSRSHSMSKLYFALTNGIVSVDSWVFSCNGCVSNTAGSLTPVSAFTTSTSSSFNYVTSINGSTDTTNLIPMAVQTGSRATRSLAPIKVLTESGEIVPNVSIRWTAPDVPGLLGSSTTSTLTSGSEGVARATLATGPVTFTLSSTLGMSQLSSGASLQAAAITSIVNATGDVVVRVPDAPEVFSRTVLVALPDGTPVPNAKVLLRNVFLSYAYRSTGTSTSTWAPQGRDQRGLFGQVGCVYCYVAAPSYITGSNGSVTFKSFAPSVRSSVFDASIVYDDGDINQTLNHNFGSINDTATMPFMATVNIPTKDADPATPAIDIIDDGTTSGVSLEVSVQDAGSIPVSGFVGTVEKVCSDMETGGLISATATLASLCGNVSATSLRTREVTAQGVRKAGCGTTPTVSTGANGRATVHLCPSVSTKYRVRGQGALASKVICVRVNRLNCGVTAQATPGTTTSGHTTAGTTMVTKRYAKNRIVPLTSIIKPSKNATVKWSIKGGCAIRGAKLATLSKVRTCTLTMTQSVKTKVNGKYKITKTSKTVKINVK